MGGWEVKPLGEVCQFVRGPFGGSLRKELFVEEGFAVYEQQHAIYDQFDDVRYFVDDVKFSEMQRFELRPGDLIMSCSGTVGRVAIAPAGLRRGIINQALLKMTPYEALEPKYLKYWMTSNGFQASLADQTGGAAIQNVASVSVLKQIKMPIPPRSEQCRLVATLDEAFDGIAIVKTNAERNRQNVRELFERQLQVLFSDHRADWATSTLGTTYDVRDGTHDSPKYHAQGYPLITSKNLKSDGLSFKDVKFIADVDFRKINERSAVHKGDVLFAMIGTIGNPTVVEVAPEFAIKNVALFKVPSNQSGHFLRYYLSSQAVIAKMRSEAKGTTQKFVGLGYLRAFPVLVPPMAQQVELVRKLDKLSTETCRLEDICAKKLAALDELERSLLQQAFRGAL